jgi:hypothetical protein
MVFIRFRQRRFYKSIRIQRCYFTGKPGARASTSATGRFSGNSRLSLPSPNAAGFRQIKSHPVRF